MPVSQITGSTGGIILTSATYDDPVTVAVGAMVGENGFPDYGLYATTNWTIQNYGSIGSQSGDGIRLTSGGTVENELGGTISGSIYGVYVTGAPGMIENSGSISGYNGGIVLNDGGVISNTGSVLISGRSGNYTAGVLIAGGSGTLDNAGSIDGSLDGVKLADGGVVTNAAGGMIINIGYTSIYRGSYATGVLIVGNSGTVDNAGSIIGSLFGVELADGGIVSNAAGGVIKCHPRYYHYDGDPYQSVGVLILGGLGMVDNAGSISGIGFGVKLTDGGLVSNAAGGVINGVIGISITGGPATVENHGYIRGDGIGVLIGAGGGIVENYGEITGHYYHGEPGTAGVQFSGGPGTIQNHGVIGSTYYGAILARGGMVNNFSSGSIIGVSIYGGSGTIENAGTIVGNKGPILNYTGVKLGGGGLINNETNGTIEANIVINGGPGTVENAGSIAVGSGIAIDFSGTGNNRLIVDAGAFFSGEVKATGSSNELELTSSATAGTLSGLGSEYVGFQKLDIDAGAAWTVTGEETGFTGVTIDFNTSDTLDLTDLAYTSGEIGAVFNRTSYLLTIYNGASPAETLQFSGAYAGLYFHASSDGASGTDITLSDNPACYCHGTRVKTDRGPVAVEDLSAGDLLFTLSGELRPIKWIGRRSYAGWLAAGNPDVQPVLFKAGSLADGIPSRDLMVSPEHAMFIDGALIPARHLVNGVSIIQTKGMEEIHYFHLQLEDHAVIFAEDAASETYLDEGNRGMFHNVYEYYEQFPDAPRGLDPEYCAPRIEEGFELDAVRRVLSARAARLRPDGTATPVAELRGNLDRVTRTLVEGWALGPDPLAILDNGAVIGRVFPDADHRFRVAMPTGFWPEIRHQIEVRRDHDWTPLPGSGLVLEPEALAA